MKSANVLFAPLLLMASVHLTGCGGDDDRGPGLPSWPIAPATVQMQTESQAPDFAAASVPPAMNALIDEADTVLFSRWQITGPSAIGFSSPTCMAATCSITIGSETINLRFTTDGVDYQPVARRQNILLAQGRSRSSEGLTGDTYEYGGWLDSNAFGINVLQIIGGESAGTIWSFGYSLGESSGTNPVGSGRAIWNGVMVGLEIAELGSQSSIIQGDAAIVIEDLEGPDVDVAFTNIVELNTGMSRDDMTWENIALTSGRFETGSAGNSIEGRFYGPGHEEAGGVFERDSVHGAFGARR